MLLAYRTSPWYLASLTKVGRMGRMLISYLPLELAFLRVTDSRLIDDEEGCVRNGEMGAALDCRRNYGSNYIYC